MCVTDFELKQFIFFAFCPIWPTCAFSTVGAIHFTHHHSGVNLTIAISYWPKVSSSFLLSRSYIKGVEITLVFGHLWLNSQNNQSVKHSTKTINQSNNQPTLDSKLRNNWTKKLQKLPRKWISFLREKKTEIKAKTKKKKKRKEK